MFGRLLRSPFPSIRQIRPQIMKKSALSSPPLVSSPSTALSTGFRNENTWLSGNSSRSYTSRASPKVISDAITIVRDEMHAKKVLKVLYAHPELIYACDTEVADIDVKKVGPVGNGKLICLSLYGGPTVDFGDGPGSSVWVENAGQAEGILQIFKDWLEDPKYKKVWHNYGFDRHILSNEGIELGGFAGDTMHMARLWDTSRDKTSGGGTGYGLETLSEELLDDPRFAKVSMKTLFGVPTLKKDGSPSKKIVLPSVLDLQNNQDTRDQWIQYSARDAVATWWLRDKLASKLQLMSWNVIPLPGKPSQVGGTMLDFYNQYMIDFAEVLTDMEHEGIKVDTKVHLVQAEQRARADFARMRSMFLAWAAGYCSPDVIKHLNPASSSQMQQFFFGTYKNGMLESKTKSFSIEKTSKEFEEELLNTKNINPYVGNKVDELKAILKDRNLPANGKKSVLISRLLQDDFELDANTAMTDTTPALPTFTDMSLVNLQQQCRNKGLAFSPDQSPTDLIDMLEQDIQFCSDFEEENLKNPNQTDYFSELAEMKKVKKQREIEITSIGMIPTDFTPLGAAQATSAVLNKLAGHGLFTGNESDAVYGTAFEFFGSGDKAKEACRAIGALANMSQIETTISNFLVPLQALVDRNERVHCSLNWNTETGRLSSRKPNLQNQPALEKDAYKIRDAFVAASGNTLIVADYGQLELRLMAHMTNCKSMLKAFQDGGCFHSRTAVGMYPHVAQAVNDGKVLLEWDYSKGQPTVPLVKDTYASERRKAKTLNFSIAYGKTSHGLAKDWGVSAKEAQDILKLWYEDRPEVKKWQDETRGHARSQGYVTTLMGRYRRLAEAGSRGPAGGHALRAAINTPIQGGAADVVMMAMIRINKSQILKALGWKLILQIHDEVILEGPKESKDEAMKEVIDCMENPFDNKGLFPLQVRLDVDAKSADSWYKAK